MYEDVIVNAESCICTNEINVAYYWCVCNVSFSQQHVRGWTAFTSYSWAKSVPSCGCKLLRKSYMKFEVYSYSYSLHLLVCVLLCHIDTLLHMKLIRSRASAELNMCDFTWIIKVTKSVRTYYIRWFWWLWKREVYMVGMTVYEINTNYLVPTKFRMALNLSKRGCKYICRHVLLRLRGIHNQQLSSLYFSMLCNLMLKWFEPNCVEPIWPNVKDSIKKIMLTDIE